MTEDLCPYIWTAADLTYSESQDCSLTRHLNLTFVNTPAQQLLTTHLTATSFNSHLPAILETRSRTRQEETGPRPTPAMDMPPESATKPALTPEVAELFRLMTMQQEKIMTANRESMIGLLQELKKGRSDQIDSDNADRQRVAEEMAERTRAQKELEERQLALREEELRVARQAEERRRVQQEEELRLRREELEAQKRREEMLEEQRQADLQQRRQELRERREAEERKARLKTISLPPPMSGKADLLEFVQLFERTARRKELPEEDWAPTLVPLLNEKYRGIAMKLPADIVDDFQQLKQALQDRDDAHTKKCGLNVLDNAQEERDLSYRVSSSHD